MRMNEAQKALAEENLYLVGLRLKCRMRYILPGEWDDYFQIGSIGLCKAAMTYTPERGAFNTYATRCIDNELMMALRYEMPRRKERQAARLDDRAGEDGMITLGDSLPDRETVETVFAAMEIKEMIAQDFTAKERQILRLCFDGHRQEDIGRAVSLSQSYVSRVIRRARRQIIERVSA